MSLPPQADGLQEYVKVGRGTPLASDGAPPRPKPQSYHLQRSWDCLIPPFYYLWNFMIYGISSLETGWRGGGCRGGAGGAVCRTRKDRRMSAGSSTHLWNFRAGRNLRNALLGAHVL